MFHIRVRPTALIIKENSILLVEYDDNGIHYNLPGGGAEAGETLIDGLRREVMEETMAEVEVGQLALVYEFSPHKQSGDYDSEIHSIHMIFECNLKEVSIPRLPDSPDLHQSAVKWVHVNELDSVLLIPNIKEQIKEYFETKYTKFIEDYNLKSFLKSDLPATQ